MRWAQRLTPAETGRRRPKDTFGKSPTAAATNVGGNGRQLAGEVIGKLRRKPAGESSRARIRKARERRPGGAFETGGERPRKSSGNRRENALGEPGRALPGSTGLEQGLDDLDDLLLLTAGQFGGGVKCLLQAALGDGGLLRGDAEQLVHADAEFAG